MDPARFVISDISRWLLINIFGKRFWEVMESFPLKVRHTLDNNISEFSFYLPTHDVGGDKNSIFLFMSL